MEIATKPWSLPPARSTFACVAEVAINSWTRYGEDRGFAPDAVEPSLRVWARNMLAARTDASMAALSISGTTLASGDSTARWVGKRLDKLTSRGWRVLHGASLGTGDGAINDVLIGPAGVFCLTIRNYAQARVWVSDKVVWVDGESRPHLRNAQLEAERATRMLSLATGTRVVAQPVLVVMGDRYKATNRRRDVRVLCGRDVPRAFTNMPATYTADEVAAIDSAARRVNAWV